MVRQKKIERATKMQKIIFAFLLVSLIVLSSVHVVKAKGFFIPIQEKIDFQDNTIILNSLSLEQKIGQMIVVHGGLHNLIPWKNMQLGGIHLFAKESPELFENIISQFQEDMEIPFIVTVDLEGCQNPFANFQAFTAAKDILTVDEAYDKGVEEGIFLKNLGFTLNFAPVVDLNDEIWGCRSYPGDEVEISKLAQAYALGLQSEGIIATAKHYPGKTLVVKDPHKFIVAAEIGDNDIHPYGALNGSVQSIMVSHIITSGAINSNGIPSVASRDVIQDLKQQFNGLIISDEVNMLGLRNFFETDDEMYIELFRAGNDIVLNFNEDPNEVYHMIEVVRDAVSEGIISEDEIDASVTKILIAKGFNVE